MADAFKCDRCGEYGDGDPKLVQVKTYNNWELETFGTFAEIELCGACVGKFSEHLQVYV